MIAATRLELERCDEQNEFSQQEEDGSNHSSHHHPSFILDSGASYHMTADKALLSAFTTAVNAATPPYRARDGRILPVAGVGTLASDNFHLSDVTFVPGLGATAAAVLVSLRQLAERDDCLVMFGGGRCYVKDQSSGKLLGLGRLHQDDGLYHLDYLRIGGWA